MLDLVYILIGAAFLGGCVLYAHRLRPSVRPMP